MTAARTSSVPGALAALALALGAQEPAAPDPAAGETLALAEHHTTDAIEAWFRELARRHPRWFRAGSLGASVQGRAIPYLAITDSERAEGKVGMWIDGAIHGDELASAQPALGVAELLRAEIASGRAPEWLDRAVIYLVPVINVDARRVSLGPPFVRQRRNLQPFDDDRDGALDEDPYADVNGDGHAGPLFAREDGVERVVGYESRDRDGDGRCGEDPLGGIDLNRNFPVARDPGDVAATPLQPETAAIVEFWERHPEIELAVSFHTSADGYVLPPVPIAERDRPGFERALAIYRDATGCGELRAEEHYVLRPALLRGITSEWFHAARGAVAFTIELAPRTSSFPRETVLDTCSGVVEALKIDPASARSHLQDPLEESGVCRHAAYLIRMAAALPLR